MSNQVIDGNINLNFVTHNLILNKMKKDIYEQRGVSSSKEDVHRAIDKLDRGIFPGAFCTILPDYWGGDENYCIIMHSDGAGTKSSLAYTYWKETGDLTVFKGIAQDAIVMNLDDLLCVGVTNEPIIYSSTIGRNKKLIPGEVISAIIEGTQEFFIKMSEYGINIIYGGGETADVGDLVRTLIVDATVAVRVKRSKIIVPNIQSGDFVIGFSSTGRFTYEEHENSSMGSNGLTSSRHDMFNKKVGRKYPESYDNKIDEKLTYCGKYNLTDPSPIKGMTMGKFVLSPTVTYAPLILGIMEMIPKKHIHAIIHCSGGGQTKVLRFINDNVEVIKDNLFETPELFKLIQKSAKTEWREMYKNFNMGHRMEVYCSPEVVGLIMAIARGFNIEAKKIGYCVEREKEKINSLCIESPYGTFHYQK